MSTLDSGFSSHKLLNGAFAGFVATAPMSLSMGIGWKLLPRREKYHLPPRLITENIAERLRVADQMNEVQLVAATLASHFGYGALFGSLYALFEQRLAIRSGAKGALFGLTLWAGSYLGWLPALDVLPPATQHPWRRNLLMILAHVVWGVTLGEMVRKLNSSN